MQAASHGTRAIGRVSQLPGPGGGLRGLHTPAFRIPHNRLPPQIANGAFNQTKTVFNKFVAYFSTPATVGAHSVGSTPHTASFINHSRAGFQSSHSLPVRHAMAKTPFGAYHMPKAPAVQRNMYQVGLGTARNFHSSRPLLQNFVKNVPVAGRALSEADWDLKMREEQKKFRVARKGKEAVQKTKSLLKPTEKQRLTLSQKEERAAAEFDRYFAQEDVAQTTTYLLIPLAPTPTARAPLPSTVSPSLIPFSVIMDIHAAHEVHSLRVSSLFARLDASQVWTKRGVSCSTYGDPSGLASILKVEFRGWTAAEVRSVLGEAGTGWCVLEQVDDEPMKDDMSYTESDTTFSSPYLSNISTPLSGFADELDSIDPANSLVLPSLDLSNHEAWLSNGADSSVPSPLLLPMHNTEDVEAFFDYSSDDGLSSYGSLSDGGTSAGSWMAVSSRVSEADAFEDGPKDFMF